MTKVGLRQYTRSYPGWTGRVCPHHGEHVYPIGDSGWCYACGSWTKHVPAHRPDPVVRCHENRGEFSRCDG